MCKNIFFFIIIIIKSEEIYTNWICAENYMKLEGAFKK